MTALILEKTTMRNSSRMGSLAALLLLSFAACAGEEPAVQDSGIDEGGMYEDGALEQVQPVEPEIAPAADTALVAPAG